MNFKFLFFGYIIVFTTTGALHISGQNNSSQSVDRDEYFRRLEQRALSLSQKFADLSGTEPVKLITPRAAKPDPLPASNTTKYSPQSFYDALPGPVSDEPSPNVQSQEGEAVIPVQKFVDDEIIEYKPTMEDRRGAYFLRPFVAVAIPREQKYNDFSVNELDSYVGYSLGLHAGRRIDNFTTGLRFGYLYHEMEKRNGMYKINADNELLSFTGTLGYSATMTDKLSFDFGVGLGFANRFNSSTATIGTLSPIPAELSKKTVFTYEFSLLLDYSYSESLSAIAGYRLVGASENGSFGRMLSHVLEAGLSANF